MNIMTLRSPSFVNVKETCKIAGLNCSAAMNHTPHGPMNALRVLSVEHKSSINHKPRIPSLIAVQTYHGNVKTCSFLLAQFVTEPLSPAWVSRQWKIQGGISRKYREAMGSRIPTPPPPPTNTPPPPHLSRNILNWKKMETRFPAISDLNQVQVTADI